MNMTEWSTNFDYNQSCWGWGNNHGLTFAEFRKSTRCTITVDIQIDDKESIIAMCEWEKYVEQQNKPKINLKFNDIKQYLDSSMFDKNGDMKRNKNRNQPKDDHMIGITRPSISEPPPPSKPPPNPVQLAKAAKAKSVPYPSIMNVCHFMLC